MNRHIAILTLGLAAVVGLSAGTIQIGGTSGLSSTYTVVGQGGITATTTATQGGGGVFGETTYGKTLAQGTSPSATVPAIGSTLTAGGVTFQMINDSVNTTDQVWVGTNDPAGLNGNPNPSTTTFTIPMGIFGVTNVYTMLNDTYGVSGANNTDVTFNFGSTGTSGSLTFDLVNGQVIADSWDCLAGSGLATCLTANYATSLSGSTFAYTSSTAVAVGATVQSLGVAWSGTYANTTITNYANTSGNLFLDAQNFYLGTFASPSTELYNIVITDSNTGAFNSRTELSAITVAQTVTTPEPSTVFLALAGILALVALGRRKLTLTSKV